MNRSIWMLVVAAACSRSTGDAPEAAPAASDPLAALGTLAQRFAGETPDLFMAGHDIAEAGDARGYAEVAPRISAALIAAWPKIEKQELAYAARAGTDRGRGKSRDNCMECTSFGVVLDKVAPHAPDVAKRWAELKPRLAAAEEAAYRTEADDPRPRVVVWATADRGNDMGAVVVMDCTVEALAKRYPDVKWTSEWQAPARSAPQIHLVAAIAFADYTSSTTHQHAASLPTGLRVGLVPAALPKALATLGPLEVSARVSSPDQIKSDLNVTPTMETTRAGMDQFDALRDDACAQLTKILVAPHKP